MDFWSAIGVSAGSGLVAAAVGLVTAALVAWVLGLRRRRDADAPGLGLVDR